jgi:hypothetical protein
LREKIPRQEIKKAVQLEQKRKNPKMSKINEAMILAEENAIKEMTQMVKGYFQDHTEAVAKKELTIDKIEDLLLETRTETERIMKKALQDAIKASESEMIKKKEICPRCEGKLIRHSEKKITLKTMYGEVIIGRSYHLCRECKYSEIPLDDELEINGLPYKITTRCQMEIAFYGQNQSSFQEAGSMINKVLNIEISGESVREITEEVGRVIFEKDTLRSKNAYENAHLLNVSENPKKTTLYIMTDGAAVNTRIEDANGSTWREGKTVMVFTDKDLIKRKDGGHIITKKEYASFIGSAEEFRKYVWDIATRNGYGLVEKVVVIADGATWIRNMCLELFPEAVQILDLYHLKENVYEYAKYKFSNDASKYVPWAESINTKLEEGQANEVLAGLPPDETTPQNVVNLRIYLENNLSKLNYPEYKKNGFFVGSGAIESAQKTVVQRRLKQAGMRWSVGGAQHVLTLRAKVESKLWDKEALWFFSASPLKVAV